jgi:hypothetical protein
MAEPQDTKQQNNIPEDQHTGSVMTPRAAVEDWLRDARTLITTLGARFESQMIKAFSQDRDDTNTPKVGVTQPATGQPATGTAAEPATDPVLEAARAAVLRRAIQGIDIDGRLEAIGPGSDVPHAQQQPSLPAPNNQKGGPMR